MSEECISRPRRSRNESQRCIFGSNLETKPLDVEEVMSLLNRCNDADGGINCSICGKLYKSKVCLTKHLWEHSVYWDVFKGDKNQDRVLSIQAAVILYAGLYNAADRMSSLLVTSPHEKKPKSPQKMSQGFSGELVSDLSCSVKRKCGEDVGSSKRLRHHSHSDCCISSSSDNEKSCD